MISYTRRGMIKSPPLFSLDIRNLSHLCFTSDQDTKERSGSSDVMNDIETPVKDEVDSSATNATESEHNTTILESDDGTAFDDFNEFPLDSLIDIDFFGEPLFDSLVDKGKGVFGAKVKPEEADSAAFQNNSSDCVSTEPMTNVSKIKENVELKEVSSSTMVKQESLCHTQPSARTVPAITEYDFSKFMPSNDREKTTMESFIHRFRGMGHDSTGMSGRSVAGLARAVQASVHSRHHRSSAVPHSSSSSYAGELYGPTYASNVESDRAMLNSHALSGTSPRSMSMKRPLPSSTTATNDCKATKHARYNASQLDISSFFSPDELDDILTLVQDDDNSPTQTLSLLPSPSAQSTTSTRRDNSYIPHYEIPFDASDFNLELPQFVLHRTSSQPPTHASQPARKKARLQQRSGPSSSAFSTNGDTIPMKKQQEEREAERRKAQRIADAAEAVLRMPRSSNAVAANEQLVSPTFVPQLQGLPRHSTFPSTVYPNQNFLQDYHLQSQFTGELKLQGLSGLSSVLSSISPHNMNSTFPATRAPVQLTNSSQQMIVSSKW
eukprot:CAMPEP_0185036084 /NCGR_PEP_ID=MMETSP1103-20130426/28522_1 /TAXON_ID=36769 /ORGANISM="Paraphysomonas bandaiensis, Strain Caron Lab Isolate" /LENGTH=551 /DNA_ID=CAMNT_0027573467 /DNA_START=79 /DNA_END=1731 /DNA_ORIENTATION=+